MAAGGGGGLGSCTVEPETAAGAALAGAGAALWPAPAGILALASPVAGTSSSGAPRLELAGVAVALAVGAEALPSAVAMAGVVLAPATCLAVRLTAEAEALPWEAAGARGWLVRLAFWFIAEAEALPADAV